MNITLTPTYDTEAVRQLLGLRTLEDVWNLTRPGGALHDAQIRRGAFNTQKVRNVRARFVRRALAAQLGRVSPRFLDHSHSRSCSECGAIAVKWEGRTLCENNHERGSNEQSTE